MAKNRLKLSATRKRQRINYTRKRRSRIENLETKRLMAADFVGPVIVSEVSPSPVMMTSQETTHDHMEMCDAHPGDPARAAEHCAAMNLATADTATHRVVTSGDWSDASIWANSALPTENARIHIPQNVAVTIDTTDATTYASIRVDGTLTFATDADTQLRVDTLITSPTGRLEMGTLANPIASEFTASIIIADRGEIDRTQDPMALGRGAILHGSTVIHGAVKTSWTTTASNPMAGDRTLMLAAAPDGWMVGDTLVIAGTKLDATGEEAVTIQQIDGNIITLTKPLQEDHVPPESDLQVHIANMTRNAFIRSETTEVSRRGHVMFMHNPDVQISYGGFYDLGRTDKSVAPNPADLDGQGRLIEGTGTNVPGRYSVHFHRHGVAANTPLVNVIGSAVIGSPSWGFVNHSSHVNFQNNVSYDVFGASFYTESGDEIGSFVNNLSIKTHGSGESPVSRGFEGEDLGHSGDGFWFQGGTGLTVTGNVAAGATGSGLIVYGSEHTTVSVPEVPFLSENLPDPMFANGSQDVPAGLTWLGPFSDNTAYGSAVGMQMYYHRSPILTDRPGQPEQMVEYEFDFPNSLIDNSTVWNVDTGVLLNYNVDVHWRNARIVNAPDQVGEDGMLVSNVYNLGEHVYENVTIQGFETGLTPSPNGTVSIDGGTFANETDIYLMYPRQNHRTLDIRGDIAFEDLPSDSNLNEEQRQNIVGSSDTRILVDTSDEWFLYYDQITLNFGDFEGQQLFHSQQVADFVPFSEQPEQVTPDDPGAPIPPEYLELTNAEMQQQFGASLGGVVATSDSVDTPDDGIVGLIGTPAEAPTHLVPKLLLGSDLDMAIIRGEAPPEEFEDNELDEDDEDGAAIEDEFDEEDEDGARSIDERTKTARRLNSTRRTKTAQRSTTNSMRRTKTALRSTTNSTRRTKTARRRIRRDRRRG